MKLFFTFFLSFSLCSFVSFGQTDQHNEDYKKFTSLDYVGLENLIEKEYEEERYDKVILYAKAIREKAQVEFGETDSIFARYTANLGSYCYMMGNYKEAEPLLLQAKNIQAKIFGEEHAAFTSNLNNLAELYRTLEEYEKAEPLYLKVIEIEGKILGKEHPDYAVSLNNLALLYSEIGNYEQAEALFIQAKNIQSKALGKDSPELPLILSNLGRFYMDIGNYEKAEPFYLQAQNIFIKTQREERTEYAANLNNLAIIYKETGNYEKAEPMYLQAKNILAKTIGEEHLSFAATINNIASFYQMIGRYEKAEPLLLQSKMILSKVLGEEHVSFSSSLNNLAMLYQKMGQYEKAEPYFLESKNIRAKVLGEEHYLFSISLNNLAGLYKTMGHYSKAEELFLQAKNIQVKVLGERHPDYAKILKNLALLYVEMDKLDTALQFCQQSILAQSEEMDSNFTGKNPQFQDWGNLDKLKYLSSDINLAILTYLEILSAQYAKTGDKNKLKLHYQIAQAAIRINDRIRNEFGSEGDKLRNLAITNNFVLAGIQTSLEIRSDGYEQDAFAFAEANKGVLLMDALKTGNAYKFGDLPDSLVSKERSLQKKHADLQAKLLERQPKEVKDSLLRVLNKTNQKIADFNKILQTKYPKYTALKYENKSATAKDIQALLDDKTALLEYVIGDSVVYVFHVTKSKVTLIPQYIRIKDLTNKIKDFHAILSNYELAIKDPAVSYQKYTENAFWFYEHLVQPALSNTKGTLKGSAKQISKLLIVSDGELGHLPFEAFLTKAAPQKETNYRELSYLSNDYKISYNYSATIWKSSKEVTKNTNNGQILAMASNYDTTSLSSKTDWRLPSEQRLRALLKPLPAARKEIETLAKGFDGYFAFDKDASEKNFKAKAADYAIIHLAMHGLLDAKNPILSSLAFTEDDDSLENNFLQAYEISKMKLNADLVVLSACETGYGRFEKGNGIASLAQAFSYAGAPALIVSLWQVNDYATSEIMKNLYQNLAEGMEKDEALQQAKMKYIKEAEGIAAHPAFWSPFILMGNTDAIYLKTKGGWTWWIIGGSILVLGSIAFAIRSRKKE